MARDLVVHHSVHPSWVGIPAAIRTHGATARPPQAWWWSSSILRPGAFALSTHSSAYGRHVSGVMESRAAVFTQQPQAVEVYQAGAWWAGELLGWRHEPDGSCRMWVRVVLGGKEETAWIDLAGLRLPQGAAVVGPSTRGWDASMTQKLPRAGAARQDRPTFAGGPGATGMPTVRGLTAVPPVGRPSGRRRAPESSDDAVQAPSVALRAGGRRRAPETAENQIVDTRSDVAASTPPAGGRRRAPEGVETSRQSSDPVEGRHRAVLAAEPGRHRTADTGLFAATSAGPAVPGPRAARPAVPAVRRQEAPGGSSLNPWSGSGAPESELLTRPMRLSDHIPHARRGRLDGTLNTA